MNMRKRATILDSYVRHVHVDKIRTTLPALCKT